MDPALVVNPPSARVLEELTCPICHLVVSDACYTACEHAFCSRCLNDWLVGNATCPSCREAVGDPGRPPRMMRNALSDLVFTCPNAEYGCQDTVSYDKFAAHVEAGCVGRTAPCPVRGCGAAVIAGTLEEHMSSDASRHMLLMAQEAQRTAAELEQTRAQLFQTTAELGIAREQLAFLQQDWVAGAPYPPPEPSFYLVKRNGAEEVEYRWRGKFSCGLPVFENDQVREVVSARVVTMFNGQKGRTSLVAGVAFGNGCTASIHVARNAAELWSSVDGDRANDYFRMHKGAQFEKHPLEELPAAPSTNCS